LFSMMYLRKIADDHFSGKTNNADRLWSIINFEIWARRFIDGEDDQEDLSELYNIALLRGQY